MINISVKHCNNIDFGNVSIKEGTLNIKYAINGTGKSTIAKAINYQVNGDTNGLESLVPYKDISNLENRPEVLGTEQINNVMVFNEEYVDQYVFQKDELIKDSFSIFIKTPNYEKNMNEIENLLQKINTSFQSHPELDSLISNFTAFIDGFGKSKTGYSAAGIIAKGLGKGNKIDNIPSDLEEYTPFLQNSADASNVKWLKWQIDGKKYLDITDKCPYCALSTANTKDKILKISETYDSKAVEHLNNIINIIDSLSPYFSADTLVQIEEIKKNASGLTTAQQNYLVEIKEQCIRFLNQLIQLKNMGFNSLKNVGDIITTLNDYIINTSLYSHLNSDFTKEKIKIINDSLEDVRKQAKLLQAKINIQNINIKKTIQENEDSINNFLRAAGYKYCVAIEEKDSSYKLLLKPTLNNQSIENVENHLSYGEKNALALILFMFNAIKENSDLIILDDPISSFDGNKKFAILYTLFLSGEKSLKKRTVLLLTHEFETVLDVIYNLPRKFSSIPNAYFLSTNNGQLVEKEINKENIQSFRQISLSNISSCAEMINKLIFARRLSEVENGKDVLWNYLSNLFHKRIVPTIYDEITETEIPMSDVQIDEAKELLKSYGIEFDYNSELSKLNDDVYMCNLYRNARSNYEKLQLYRIINNENSNNLVVKKFVNETFHVENDYLFQLNPREYDTVPQFIIDECDKDLLEDKTK